MGFKLILEATDKKSAQKLATMISMAADALWDEEDGDASRVQVALKQPKKEIPAPAAKPEKKKAKPAPVAVVDDEDEDDSDVSDDTDELDGDSDGVDDSDSDTDDEDDSDTDDSDSDVEDLPPPKAKKGPGRPPKEESKKATAVEKPAKATGSKPTFESLKAKLKQLSPFVDGNSRGKDLLGKVGAKTLVDLDESKYARLNEGLDKLLAELNKSGKKKAA